MSITKGLYTNKHQRRWVVESVKRQQMSLKRSTALLIPLTSASRVSSGCVRIGLGYPKETQRYV